MTAPIDPGLQPERTALAWRRTALAVLVNGALLVRSALGMHSPFFGTVAGLILASGLALLAVSWWRASVLLGPQPQCAPPAALPAFVLVVVWAACAGAVLGAV